MFVFLTDGKPAVFFGAQERNGGAKGMTAAVMGRRRLRNPPVDVAECNGNDLRPMI